MAGHAYAQATEPILHMEESSQLGETAILNAENTARVLDQMIAELRQMRQAIAEKDDELLKSRLEHAREGRELWWKQRLSADWEAKSNVRMPSSGEFIGRLFGLRPKKDKEPDKKK